MKNIHVDTKSLQFTFAGTVTPVAVYKDGKRQEGQATDETGVPVWRISVLIADGTTLETETVKVPSATEPKFDLGTPLNLEGLVANPVGSEGGRVSVYLAASGVSAVKGRE